jgi:outer membrane lipoprotein-sorting protein
VSINRPGGQFLWQYATPVKQKVVGTGTAVYYVDQSARGGDGQVTQLPLDAGLGRLLRGAPLSLAKVGLQVNKVSDVAGLRVIGLRSTQARQDQQGLRSMRMTFNTTGKAPVLVNFAATDTLGVTTQISLSGHQPGVALAKSLFAFKPGLYRER